MARILMDVDKVRILPKIGRHFDEIFEENLETKKIRQNDGRFRRNLTPEQIHLHPSHP